MKKLGREQVWKTENVGDAEDWNCTAKAAIIAREHKEWAKGIAEKPKLRTYKLLKSKLCFEEYLSLVPNAKHRRVITMFRSDTNDLRRAGMRRSSPCQLKIASVCSV